MNWRADVRFRRLSRAYWRSHDWALGSALPYIVASFREIRDRAGVWGSVVR